MAGKRTDSCKKRASCRPGKQKNTSQFFFVRQKRKFGLLYGILDINGKEIIKCKYQYLIEVDNSINKQISLSFSFFDYIEKFYALSDNVLKSIINKLKKLYDDYR